MNKWVVVGVALAAAVTSSAQAGEGDLDPGFATGGLRRVAFDRGGTEAGKADHLVDVLRMPDGRILLLGGVNDDIDNTGAGVARLLPNGMPDTSFDGDGRAVVGFIAAITPRGFGVQPSGHIVIAATPRDDPGPSLLLRLDANGVPDGFPDAMFFNASALHIPGSPITEVAGLHMLADGRFLLFGTVQSNLGDRDFFIARLTAAGALDASFGASPGYTRIDFDLDLASNDQARALAVAPDGRLALIGEATAQDAEVAIAMLDDDGDLLADFDDDGRAIVDFDIGSTSQDHGVAGCFRDDGRLAIAANIDLLGGNGVGTAVLNPTGSILQAYGGGMGRVRYAAFSDTWAARLACVGGNRTVMVGTLANPAPDRGPTEAIVVRFDALGSPDGSFGQSFGAATFGLNRTTGGREDRGMALAIGPRGELLVGFDAQYNGADWDYGVAKLQGTGLFADGFE